MSNDVNFYQNESFIYKVVNSVAIKNFQIIHQSTLHPLKVTVRCAIGHFF